MSYELQSVRVQLKMINTFKRITNMGVEHFGKEFIASSVFVRVFFLCASLFKEGTGDKVQHVFVLRGKLFLLFYDWRHLLQECTTVR